MPTPKKTPRKAPPKKGAPEVKKTPWRELTGVVFFAVGALLVYYLWIAEKPSAIDNFMMGAVGSLRHIVPLILFYAGLLLIFKANQPLSKNQITLTSLFVLFFFTLFHVFYADAIVDRMSVYSFANFVNRSMTHGTGGGFLGALLSWPIYWTLGLGKVGAATILIFLLLGDLILMGKVSLTQVGEKVQTGFQGMREQRALRASEAEERRQLHVDEFYDEKPAPIRAPSKRTRAHDEPQQPREMKIERIRPDEEEAPIPYIGADVFDEDGIPDFLSTGKRTKRKKKSAPAVEIETPPAKQFGFAEETPSPTPPAFEPEDEVPFDITPYEEPITGEKAESFADFDMADFEEVDPFSDIEPAPVKEPPKKAKPAERAQPAPPPTRESAEDDYAYPPIDLLAASKPSKAKNQEQQDYEKAQKLIETLKSFGIQVSLLGIAHGPTVTRYELSPAAGIKVSRITSLADDIALSLAAVSVRIEAPIPGKAAVGVEVPNDVIETVPLRDVLESGEARKYPSRIAAALGRDNAGNNIVADLAKMPHVLIAGATGAGKSVCINCIICSILYRATPEEVRMIMIDPKVVELSAYNGIPHLLVPVVTDPKKAAGALSWAVAEMTKRYTQFADLGVRDIKGYNARRPEGEPAMPQIVLIIDELADLMMVTPGEVEDAICRLAQLARAAGIHLVIATQRPSVNVITGVIKANIPSRIAFTVASQVDSRTILDVGGAEKLLGRGDMLYAPSGTNKPLRVQGAWISDDEVTDVVEYIKVRHDTEYDEDIIEKMERAEMSDEEQQDADDEYDELLPQAIETVIEAGQASISMLQRKLRVGYARAGRLIDEMSVRGIVSQAEGAKPRNVLITREQFNTMFND